MEKVDDGTLMVRLEWDDFDVELGAMLDERRGELWERRTAVDGGFSGPQEVEVGSVD